MGAVLSERAVNEIFGLCLWKQSEDETQQVHVEGITAKTVFNRVRLSDDRVDTEIIELLSQLGRLTKGSRTFENFQGTPWTKDPQVVERLVLLGLGSGRGELVYPREVLPILPNNLVYFRLKLSS